MNAWFNKSSINHHGTYYITPEYVPTRQKITKYVNVCNIHVKKKRNMEENKY